MQASPHFWRDQSRRTDSVDLLPGCSFGETPEISLVWPSVGPESSFFCRRFLGPPSHCC